VKRNSVRFGDKAFESWRPNILSFLLLTVLLTGIVASAQQAPGGVPQGDNSLLSDGQLHVVLCGTGSPLPDATRASACVAVLAGGEFVLIDTGPGSWRKVALSKLPTQALSAILLTHFHSDHIGDLGEALMQSWGAGRGKPLDVYGPPGVERVVAGFQQAYALDTEYRVAHHGEPTMPRAAAGAVARPVILKTETEAATVFERNGLKVTAFKVEHDPATPAYGYRLEYRGRVVVISGDTGKSANVAKYATGADLLIHDVLAKDLLLFACLWLSSRISRTRRCDQRRHRKKRVSEVSPVITLPVERLTCSIDLWVLRDASMTSSISSGESPSWMIPAFEIISDKKLRNTSGLR